MQTEIDFLEEEKAIQEDSSWMNQRIFSDITEEFYQRGSFSVFIIHAVANGRIYEGVGFSKARQEMSAARYDSDRGRSISRGRAIHDLYSELKKDKQKRGKTTK
jgi:hypothetical protein